MDVLRGFMEITAKRNVAQIVKMKRAMKRTDNALRAVNLAGLVKLAMVTVLLIAKNVNNLTTHSVGHVTSDIMATVAIRTAVRTVFSPRGNKYVIEMVEHVSTVVRMHTGVIVVTTYVRLGVKIRFAIAHQVTV